MKLEAVLISNYRCFGKEPTQVAFEDLTALIGHNSSGKTAILTGLVKLFGEKASDRNIYRSDFHVPNRVPPDTIIENELYIEARFQFPELDESTGSNAVPIFFKNFVVSETGGRPYLRIRLEANWKKSTSPEGSIEAKTYFITTSSEEITEADKCPATRHVLDNIKVIYVPAIRKPDEQLKNVSGTIIARLLNGINWTEATKTGIKEKTEEVERVFFQEEGVSKLRDTLGNQWGEYHSDERYSNAKLQFNSTNLETILKKVEVTFSPTEIPREYRVEELGDGLRSLFYLSLVNTMLEVEEGILLSMSKGEDQTAFSLLPPVLTIVAVEEPENHISPHLLGRVIDNLQRISNKANSQTILTSHTPAIVKRVDPQNVRYFRICKSDECTKVRSITLPDCEKEEEQFKYVKEAVLAYPELYFAKMVVLGEGDSEEIIIRKMLEIKGTHIDSSGISIVPLGGRHVNHFWRLLNDLEIPFITLLDLDRERFGGGWGRIKYVLKQLLNNGVNRDLLLKTESCVLSEDGLNGMHEWDVKEIECMISWIKFLRTYNVYFSSPLDIDFAMLTTFKDKYLDRLSEAEGPRIKGLGKISELEVNDENRDKFNIRVGKDVRSTLKEEGGDGDTYSEEEKELMIWYTYLFLNRGKPTTHLTMISHNSSILFDDFPECLKVFIEKIIQICTGADHPEEVVVEGDE